MKKFLVSFYATAEVLSHMQNATKEEIAEATKPWMAWKAANEANIVDFGSRLFGGVQKNMDSDWSPQEQVKTGYSILQGNSKEEIKGILANHPQLHWNPACSLSVHEFLPM